MFWKCSEIIILLYCFSELVKHHLRMKVMCFDRKPCNYGWLGEIVSRMLFSRSRMNIELHNLVWKKKLLSNCCSQNQGTRTLCLLPRQLHKSKASFHIGQEDTILSIGVWFISGLFENSWSVLNSGWLLLQVLCCMTIQLPIKPPLMIAHDTSQYILTAVKIIFTFFTKAIRKCCKGNS